MHFPVFGTVSQGIARVLRRFLFSMVAALTGTVSAYLVIHFDYLNDEWSLYRLIMTSVLGFLLFVVIQLKLERKKFEIKHEYLIKAIAILFLGLYYWLLPSNFDHAPSAFMIHFFLLVLALLLSLIFAPFIRNMKEINGFWQYNKILFVRLFLTFVFTGTLYLGLALALVGIKELLGIDFDEKLFLEMWVMIVGFIATSFFLAGIPEKISVLQKKTDYYKGIRIFAQYILTPLILVYAVILYIYTAKIILHWDWPEGKVSWLIIVFSFVTILANVMLYPLLKKERWVGLFLRVSHALIVPMSVVMIMAFKIRISQYGVTELRYYGIVLCFWLALISLYFILSKKKNIIFLPLSVFIIILVTSAGPWSSMNVSLRSQLGRLESVLLRNEILVEGKIQKATGELSKLDTALISGSLDYIGRVHGYKVIQPWFNEDLDAVNQKNDCYAANCVMDLMGLSYLSSWQVTDLRHGTGFRSYMTDQDDPIPIAGYSEMSEFYLSGAGTYSRGMDRLEFNPDNLTIIYLSEGSRTVINIYPFISELIKSDLQQRQWDYMRVDEAGIGLIFRSVNLILDEQGGIKEIVGLDGYLLTK